MTRVKHCLIVIVGIGMTACSLRAQANGSFDRAWADLKNYHRLGLESAGIVGSSMMFLQNGDVVAESYHGFADLETRRPVDAETIFHWASNTKMLTAIAIMQLRDRGRLRLDDPIVDYIPDLRAVHNPFGSMSDITIGHLLSHSAGFRASTWPWKDRTKGWQPHEPVRWEQLVAMFPYTEILFEPGSKYSYSNPGIIFLGRVIELLTGDDYEVYIDKNILKPLGMHRSYFDHTPYHLQRNRSNNYAIENGEMTTNGLDFDTGITSSNGGLNAPLGDIAKFVTFLIGSDAHREKDDAILGRSSLEEMWQVRQSVADDSTGTWGMGLGFFIQVHGERRIVGHTGGQKAFTTFIYVEPQSRTGCIAAFNTTVVNRDESGKYRSPSRELFNGLRARFFNEFMDGHSGK